MAKFVLAIGLTMAFAGCLSGGAGDSNKSGREFCGAGDPDVGADGGPNDLIDISGDTITCPGASVRVEDTTTICLWECAEIDSMFYRIEVFLTDLNPPAGECVNSPGSGVTPLNAPCTPTN